MGEDGPLEKAKYGENYKYEDNNDRPLNVSKRKHGRRQGHREYIEKITKIPVKRDNNTGLTW